MEKTINPEQRPKQMAEPMDISTDFEKIFRHGLSPDPYGDWNNFTRSIRNVEFVTLKIDLSDEIDKNSFIQKARFIKAFNDGGTNKLDLSQYPGKRQRRQTVIRCTEEQMRWEPNAFGSGVEWEKIK